MVAVINQPRSWQYWAGIAATPAPFNLDAGNYALIATWTVGTVQLQKLLPDGVTYVSVSAALAAPGAGSGYSLYSLPAGQYQLLFAGGVAGFSGVIEKIDVGRR